MNSKIDSFRKTMALEEVNQVPVIPMVGAWLENFSGIPLQKLHYDEAAAVQVQIDAQKAVGYDALFAGCDPLCIPEAFGCSIGYLSSDTAEIFPLDLQSEADIDALPILDVRRSGRLPLALGVAEQLVKLPRRKVPVIFSVEGLFTTCARIMGTEQMLRAVSKKSALVERMLEKIGVLFAELGQAVEECGIDGFIVPEPVSSASMVSPRLYQKMVLPHLHPFIKGLKTPIILHVCGHTEMILDMMAETGARILSLDQCMDLAAARQQVADRCGVGGNVDPIILLQGTVEDVKRDTLRCLLQGGKKGFILMSGCSVPPHTPIENLKAMIKTASLQS